MTLNIAIIGAGGVARRHAQVLDGLPEVRVTAVADTAPAAAEALAAEVGARAYGEVEQALDSGVDAAYVCVPPFAHGAAERAAIGRGLPLFVEKPVAADLATSQALAAEIERAGIATGTGYHWRCLDVLDEVRQRLADAPAYLATGYWLDKRPPVGWWSHRDRSGGQVVEQMTHVLDVARLLLGEPVEVYAAGVRVPASQDVAELDGDRGDVDDATAVTLRFAGGAVATMAATSLLDAKHRAGLHLYSRSLITEVVESGAILRDAAGARELSPSEDPKVAVDREFVEVVRGERESTRAPYAEALRSHAVACAVVESARTGAPVRPADLLAVTA